MATQVTLIYKTNATGMRTASQLAAAMNAASVPTPSWVTPITGATVISDNTTSGGGVATRTIIYNVATPVFERRFRNNPTAPFYGLMTQILRAAIGQPVLEAAPEAT